MSEKNLIKYNNPSPRCDMSLIVECQNPVKYYNISLSRSNDPYTTILLTNNINVYV